MTIPPRFTFASMASFAAHPRWCFGAFANPTFELANVAQHVGELGAGSSIIEYINR
jgi:L-lactate dehydrogenase (cytochrome)